MARLVLTCDGVDLVTHELVGDVITIGTAPLNHIVIDNPAVSAQHAILARVADSYLLKDLHSTNGTHVNGISITDAELRDGDKIQFGSVVAVFCEMLPPRTMTQTSYSPADPLILPVSAQAARESPMAMAEVSATSSRKLTLIAVAVTVLMIVGGAAWYLGHNKKIAPEKLDGSTQPQRQIRRVNPTEHAARAQKSRQEIGPKEEFSVSNSLTIAQSSMTARGPWLFPDSSSRYLSTTDLSSLSSADLWRARNEIFARKGYKFSSPKGIAFAQTLAGYYRPVDDNQGRVFNNMNQYERANVTLIRSIEQRPIAPRVSRPRPRHSKH